MFKPRPCGCKGIRTCLVCEPQLGLEKGNYEEDGDGSIKGSYEYCHICGKAWEGSHVEEKHPKHQGLSLDFPGVLLVPNFITEEEERVLVEGCDSLPWDLSQSGRRKQNFGPKTNFKKKKINGKSFEGFPKFSEFAQQKLRSVKFLHDFQTIEQCAIEYRTETGASIDPHIDDCWVWGERVISINLLSDSILTMSKYTGPKSKYNISYFFGENCNETSCGNGRGSSCSSSNGSLPVLSIPKVRIPMPRRSLLVLYGPARYEWEHEILRPDITQRRICMAYREFTPEYLIGGKNYKKYGEDILGRAKIFF